VTAAGVFLTHRDLPRIRRHFRRLVAETGSLVTWHFVLSRDAGPRPQTAIPAEDPADVLPVRYRTMEQNGGVQGGYLDTLLLPLLRALPADHLWVIEYDVDFAGRWDDLFRGFADNDADLLTTTLMHRHDQPQWPWWRSAQAPEWVPEEQWIRSLNPLMRLSRRLVNSYCVAMADDTWRGHYEFTLATAALAGGLRIEDLGGDGPFTPEARRSQVYVGKSPQGKPADLTFGFRPVRRRYFHEAPEKFDKPGFLYHPVKPGVPAWTLKTMNAQPEQEKR
jgi:hypothetical protein